MALHTLRVLLTVTRFTSCSYVPRPDGAGQGQRLAAQSAGKKSPISLEVAVI